MKLKRLTDPELPNKPQTGEFRRIKIRVYDDLALCPDLAKNIRIP